MKHGSLFSGLGGFDLAAEWMGWENVFHCEWMEFPRKVLDYHFPNADSHIDICKTDFKKYANKIDILTGGFPCQPFSLAGKRKGTDDERYLWGEMLRAIQEIKPTFVIAENVFGITNIDGGLVFEQVCLDLETEGYEVQPFIIPAAAKNAPHRRDRVWFIAYSNGNGLIQERRYDSISKNVDGCNTSCEWSTNSKDIDGCGTNGVSQEQSTISKRISQQANGEKNKTPNSRAVCGMDKANNCKGTIGKNRVIINKSGTLVSERQSRVFSSINRGLGNHKASSGELANMGLSIDISRINSMDWDATNTDSNGLNQCNGNDEEQSSKGGINALGNTNKIPSDFQDFPTQSPICSGDDGLPTELDGITFPKWRAESIKGYGNAIVPQVAYEIFKKL